MLCKTSGCNGVTSGKSKYCATHKRIARENWKAMITAKAEEREKRLAGYNELWERAKAAGITAGENEVPEPMIVQQKESPLNDASPVKKEWFVSGGVCGFASIIIRPRNCSFAHYAKKYHDASKSYYGGLSFAVFDHGQSYERKCAHARAMASVLRDGLKKLDPKAQIRVQSRLD